MLVDVLFDTGGDTSGLGKLVGMSVREGSIKLAVGGARLVLATGVG